MARRAGKLNFSAVEIKRSVLPFHLMFQTATSALSSSILAPAKALKKRYIPLLLIYFAYGFQTVTSVTLTFWEKEALSLSAVQLASLSVWVTMPWTMKMIVGQFVDNKPLFGSRRKAYVGLGAVLMTIGYLSLVGLMMKAPWIMWMGSEFVVYLFASLVSAFGFVIQDVTADAMSTEIVDREGRSEKVIQKDLAMVQILGRLSLFLAATLAASLTGYLAEVFQSNPEKVIILALIIPVISVLGVSFVKLDIKHHKPSGFDATIMSGGILYALFVLFMAFLGPISSLVPTGILASTLQFVGTYAQEFTLIVSFILLFYMLRWVLRKESPKQMKQVVFVLLAIFFFRAVPLIGPGFSWWAIDVLGFDREFFGVLKIITATVPFVILWLLAGVIAEKSVRSILLILTVLGAILSLPELGLYYGVHEMLGMSPYFVAIADTVLDSPLNQIAMIPMLAMIAFYAPSGTRATWFAVAASLMNLALTIGSLITKYLNQIFVVQREVLDEFGNVLVAQDYSQLGSLMIVKILIGLVMPLVAIWIFLKKDIVSGK